MKIETPRLVYRSTLFIVLRQIEDLEREGVSFRNMPINQCMALQIDVLAALIPWRNQLLPLARREAVCAKLMRFATRLGPIWNQLLVQFIESQIGRAGISRWIEEHAPLWAVRPQADGSCQVLTLSVPEECMVCRQTFYVPVHDVSELVSEN